VRELATGSFLDAKRNAIFIGGTGTAKTICASPSRRLIRERARGRFFNLVDLVNQLEQERPRAAPDGCPRSCCVRHHRHRRAGLLPFSQSGGQLLFHLISKLYENTSLLITTNLAFADWAAGVRRRQDDHRHARPAHPSLRHHRDRKRKLALQKSR